MYVHLQVIYNGNYGSLRVVGLKMFYTFIAFMSKVPGF